MSTETDQNMEPTTESSTDAPTVPSINIFTMFRLGLFQMGLGIMSLLTLGVLNRVMIDELKVPALIASGALAMHQVVAPARVWFGQMSDAKPIFGMHRTGYVWIGAALFTSVSFLAVQVVWQLGNSMASVGELTNTTYAWAGVLALVFTIYGLALSASSTPFAALLVDISDEDNRSQLIGIVWSMLMVGIIIGAIVSSILLKPLTLDTPVTQMQDTITWLFVFIPAIVFAIAMVSTVGIESKYSRYTNRSSVSDREDSITLGKALKVLTASRQTGFFFTFLLVMTISLFMQEAVLEPYGGEVFGMPISETTKLNAFWGTGTLIGLSGTGFWITPRLGKHKTTRLGCLLSSGTFVIIILAGFTHNPQFLQYALLLFGLALGMTTTGALSLMLDLTVAETAGTFIGAWGLSQAIARALATVFGGAILDFGKWILVQVRGVADVTAIPEPELLPAYAVVFGLQAAGMLLAVWFLNRVNIKEFRDNSQRAVMAVIESDLD